ncbi:MULTISPECIES: hypothetical protein [Candidatus Ichthyocystis]|uniref:Putative exported protein n=1 Tax=Candidatus Ichthyocystis hellenicum TaxID=1561003 RepID=A0A0S4M560_9BURK|nr:MULTISPECIES: hypothetical protein [Ichthyocystis]CUT18108.1 putative exported protein [Candidatus Ichthyocystis hellenicum]
MKKTLSIVSAILSAVIISGCLDSSKTNSATNSNSRNKPIVVGNNMKTGYIGSLKIPDRSVLPQDIAFDPAKESLIVSGAGKESIERGQIWEAGRDETVFSVDPVVTTGTETFLKGDGISYDPFKGILYACSNPGNRLSTVHPTVVVFERNNENEFIWKAVINFETKDHEYCAKLHLLDGFLFVVNKFADDKTYAALYSVNTEVDPLPANLGVSVTYEKIGYDNPADVLNKPLINSIQRVEQHEIGTWKLLLLDQNKKQIFEVALEKPTTATDPLALVGSIKKRSIPGDIDTPLSFLNRDDELMFIADKDAVYSAMYSKEGELIKSSKFSDLSLNMNVTGMSFGQDKFGATIYPVFFLTSQTLHKQSYYTVDEFAFDPITGM